MLERKIFSKIEHYWLNNFQFRQIVKRNDYSDFCSYFAELKLKYEEFNELVLSTFCHDHYWISSVWEEDRKIQNIYNFGWKLGLEGKINLLLRRENWSIAEKIDPVWCNKKRDELKDLESELYLGFFFEGLRGVLIPPDGFLKEAILLNCAGYDFYWQKESKII